MKKLLLIFVAVLAFSCGNNNKKEEQTTTPTTIGTQEREEPASLQATSNAVTLTIEGNDQMQFNKKEMRVKAGQKVTLILKHVGQMDEKVMGHNWVLLAKGTDVNEFGIAAATAADNDYIPADMEDQVIAYTETIGGGEETRIEFEAPAAGTYDFICSFPGHVALMKGKFIVE